MKDQVKNLGQKDIDAKFIQDSFDNTAEDTKVKITSGNYSIILISPELLLSDTIWVYIYHKLKFKVKVVAIALTYATCNFVDLLENLAHCIDIWPTSSRCGHFYCKQ